MTIWLSCIPPKTSHHAKRIVRFGGFSRLADKPELVEAKATLDALLLEYQPTTPISGPVSMSLTFVWPWLASDAKRLRQASGGRVWHPKRPDCSNLAKTLEDRLVRLQFIADDNAVVRLTVEKYRGDKPGIGIDITPAQAARIPAKAAPRRADALQREHGGIVLPDNERAPAGPPDTSTRDGFLTPWRCLADGPR